MPIGGRSAAVVVSDLLVEMLEAVRRGHMPTIADVDYALREARQGSDPELRGARDQGLDGLGSVLAERSPTLRHDIHIKPRTRGQKEYLDAIRTCELTLGIGPAGTGKTYLAMAAAVSALLNKEVNRLILTRPAVEAGESLGFLPGDLEQKVNPYLRPLYDALYSLLDLARARRLIDREKVEVAPLAFMRGRTLDHAFVILDEAQNTTSEQMKMFLTRLGAGSRAVVTGDITQIDLPKGAKSGLIEAKRILRNVKEVAIVHLTKLDVVRHPLVQSIVDAYEADVADSDRDSQRPGGPVPREGGSE
ncbi:MAG: PhoH family protein [Candidatus Hydrogenedentes bacterium]|nr:PhoH family protein [Candidatus Hydrogenedentota bacterium]